ncbi:MAG: alpha/beta hydrolase [Candidatus Wallbacteria bacterium]
MKKFLIILIIMVICAFAYYNKIRSEEIIRTKVFTQVKKADDGYGITYYHMVGQKNLIPVQKKANILYIQGSSYGSILKILKNNFRFFPKIGFEVYAVEKRGFDSFDTNPVEAYRYSNKETRVHDTLQIINNINASTHEKLPFVVIAESEGCDVAAEVCLKVPEITHLILLGGGGGLSQAEEFKVLLSKKGTYLNMKKAEDFDKKFNEIKNSTDELALWAGHPYKRWKSYLFDVAAKRLLKLKIPVLSIHGAEDDSVPVESARELVKTFEKNDRKNLTYFELANASHSFKDVQSEKSLITEVVLKIFEWLKTNKLLTEDDMWMIYKVPVEFKES